MKKYIPVACPNGINATDLEIAITYTKPGINLFTGKPVQGGYYLSITPVNRAGQMIEHIYCLNRGGTVFLIEGAKRYSRKKHDEIKAAINRILYAADLDSTISGYIANVATNHGLTLK